MDREPTVGFKGCVLRRGVGSRRGCLYRDYGGLGVHGEDIGAGANELAGAESLGRNNGAGLLGVGDHHRGDYRKAGGLDGVDIEFGKNIAPLDLIALHITDTMKI